MKIDFKGILEGVINSVFVRESIEKIAEERTAICRGCPVNSDIAKKNGYTTFRPDFHCTNCGCDIHFKTRSLSQVCPLGKWKAEITQEQENELDKKLSDESKSR